MVAPPDKSLGDISGGEQDNFTAFSRLPFGCRIRKPNPPEFFHPASGRKDIVASTDARVFWEEGQ